MQKFDVICTLWFNFKHGGIDQDFHLNMADVCKDIRENLDTAFQFCILYEFGYVSQILCFVIFIAVSYVDISNFDFSQSKTF